MFWLLQLFQFHQWLGEVKISQQGKVYDWECQVIELNSMIPIDISKNLNMSFFFSVTTTMRTTAKAKPTTTDGKWSRWSCLFIIVQKTIDFSIEQNLSNRILFLISDDYYCFFYRSVKICFIKRDRLIFSLLLITTHRHWKTMIRIGTGLTHL